MSSNQKANVIKNGYYKHHKIKTITIIKKQDKNLQNFQNFQNFQNLLSKEESKEKCFISQKKKSILKGSSLVPPLQLHKCTGIFTAQSSSRQLFDSERKDSNSGNEFSSGKERRKSSVPKLNIKLIQCGLGPEKMDDPCLLDKKNLPDNFNWITPRKNKENPEFQVEENKMFSFKKEDKKINNMMFSTLNKFNEDSCSTKIFTARLPKKKKTHSPSRYKTCSLKKSKIKLEFSAVKFDNNREAADKAYEPSPNNIYLWEGKNGVCKSKDLNNYYLRVQK